MKRFIQIYLMCLVFMVIFFFFGGFYLFSVMSHPYRAAASIAFLVAVLICICIGQEERIDRLEKRIEELEAKNTEAAGAEPADPAGKV